MPPGPRLDGLSVAERNKTGNAPAWIPWWQCLLACLVLAVMFWEPSWLQLPTLDVQTSLEKNKGYPWKAAAGVQVDPETSQKWCQPGQPVPGWRPAGRALVAEVTLAVADVAVLKDAVVAGGK